MPGGRPILGRDLQAALRAFGPAAATPPPCGRRSPTTRPSGATRSWRAPRRPSALGLTSGAHAALFGPLFGEFE